MEKRYPVHESDAMEVMYRDSNNKDSSVDSDQVQCTHSMWQKFVQSMPPSNTNSLSFMSREGEKQYTSCDYPTPAI